MKSKRLTKKLVKKLLYQAFKAGEGVSQDNSLGGQNYRFAALRGLFPWLFTKVHGG